MAELTLTAIPSKISTGDDAELVVLIAAYQLQNLADELTHKRLIEADPSQRGNGNWQASTAAGYRVAKYRPLTMAGLHTKFKFIYEGVIEYEGKLQLDSSRDWVDTLIRTSIEDLARLSLQQTPDNMGDDAMQTLDQAGSAADEIKLLSDGGADRTQVILANLVIQLREPIEQCRGLINYIQAASVL